MPRINIEQPHSLSAADAKVKLDQLGQDLSSKYGLAVSWPKDTEAKVERTGAKGIIRIDPAKILVDLDLSFVLSPMKGQIEDKIREELRKLFG